MFTLSMDSSTGTHPDTIFTSMTVISEASRLPVYLKTNEWYTLYMYIVTARDVDDQTQIYRDIIVVN